MYNQLTRFNGLSYMAEALTRPKWKITTLKVQRPYFYVVKFSAICSPKLISLQRVAKAERIGSGASYLESERGKAF